MSDVSVLDVRLYDEPIGTLTHVGGDRLTCTSKTVP